MSSSFTRKLRYVKERCVNAYWMLREGKFKLILQSILTELHHRKESLHTWLKRSKVLDDSVVPFSSYIDRRKVIPASYRPTVSRVPVDVVLQVDREAISNELQSIISRLKVRQGKS